MEQCPKILSSKSQIVLTHPSSNTNHLHVPYMKLSIQCTRFQINYSSCTGRSSENICSRSGGAQEKGKTG